MQTQALPDFSSLVSLTTDQNQHESTIIVFGNAQDPASGWLCPDYGKVFQGRETGNLYLSPMHYMLYAGATLLGLPTAGEILGLTKKVFETSGQIGVLNPGAVHEAHQAAMQLFFIPSGMEPLWQNKMLGFMARAVLLTFFQNQELRKLLIETGGKNLIYASPDAYWGIGSNDPSKIMGENVYGRVLTTMRNHFHNNNFTGLESFLPMLEASEKHNQPTQVQEKAVSHPRPENIPEAVAAAEQQLKEKEEAGVQVAVEAEIDAAIQETVEVISSNANQEVMIEEPLAVVEEPLAVVEAPAVEAPSAMIEETPLPIQVVEAAEAVETPAVVAPPASEEVKVESENNETQSQLFSILN